MASNNKNKKKLGWHFLPQSRELTNGDGRGVKVGVTLSMRGGSYPSCCNSGMHASVDVHHAASFRKGPVLSRVEVWGDISEGGDKFCGRHRRAIWMKEVTDRDLRLIAKDMGAEHAVNTYSDVTYGLHGLAQRDPGAFDKAVEAWAKKNGLGQALKPSKPILTEKDVLALLLPRVIRTEKELRRDIGKFYDLSTDDSSYSDLLDELLAESSRVMRLEDIDGNGTEGFIRIGR